jgi:hypothetical protein
MYQDNIAGSYFEESDHISACVSWCNGKIKQLGYYVSPLSFNEMESIQINKGLLRESLS